MYMCIYLLAACTVYTCTGMIHAAAGIVWQAMIFYITLLTSAMHEKLIGCLAHQTEFQVQQPSYGIVHVYGSYLCG